MSHVFPAEHDFVLFCFCEDTLALYASDELPALSTALYVVLDLTPVMVAGFLVFPAHVLIPDPASEHVHVNVTPAVFPVLDFLHVIGGVISSLHVAEYVLFAVGGFVTLENPHVYPAFVAVGTVIVPPDH